MILGMPRSGTSMVAGIFHLHGVWVGRCRLADDINPKGYFENLDFKALNIKAAGRLAQSGEFPKKVPRWFRSSVERFAPKSGRWMAKFSAMYYPLWQQFDPIWIKVRRYDQEIMSSNLATGFFGTKNKARIIQLIDQHNEAMDHVDGVDVHASEIIKGDFRSIAHAIHFAGLDYKPSQTAKFVDPKLWRHGIS